MVRAISRLLVCVLALGAIGAASACATVPAGPAPRDPSPYGSPYADARSDPGVPRAPGATEDVDILRERVTRLERRLADVDAKLGLLLAQRQGGGRDRTDRQTRDDRAPTALARGRDAYAPGGYEPPREEASLGARTIDLPPRGGQQELEDVREAVEPSDVDDGSEPVVIRLDGRGAPAPESASSGGPQINLGASVDEVYQWGMSQMKAGQLLDALAAFEDVTERAASHDLADNAMYWTGACHARRGDHKVALDVWQRLPVRYPKSPKIADTLFGMAQSHEALGEPALAETLYMELVTQYPKAEKVRDAHKALRRLRPR